MFCTKCKSEQNLVVNTRHSVDGMRSWRRRKCLKCGNLFTTHEIIDMTNIVVIKRSGKRERFSRIKLFSGILWASIGVKLVNREKKIEKISHKIEGDIISLNKNILESNEIAQIVTKHLYETHIALFLRFTSYRSQIKTRRQFFRELRKYNGGNLKHLEKTNSLQKRDYGDFG